MIKFRIPDSHYDKMHSFIHQKNPNIEVGLNPSKLKSNLVVFQFSCIVVDQMPETEIKASSKQFFTKLYFLKNNGVSPWPATTTIAYVDGDDFQFKERLVGELGVNNTRKVQILFTSPEKPGLYTTYLRLKQSCAGEYFGNRIKCSIEVKNEKEVPCPLKRKPILKRALMEYSDDELQDELSSNLLITQLPGQIQTQALNLWKTGVTKDKNKFIDLVYKHKFNISQVANDLFASQAS